MKIREYQQKIAWEAHGLLCSLKIAYLCMEVRTGKTLTAFHAAELYGAKKVLFVTKLKAIGGIKKDFEAASPGFELYLINYESLHKCDADFDLVILDECHCLGQYPKPANRVQELKRICEGKPIIYLSGTPTPESYSQFYHQFYVSSFSPFSEYTNFYKWYRDFGIPGKKYLYNREIVDYSKTKTAEVMARVRSYILTYTQEEAGFTNMVEEEILRVPMPEKTAAAIRLLKRDKIFTTREGGVVLADTAVKEMQKVHQMCSGTVKYEDGNATVFDYSKAMFIKERFAGKKIAIFYKYVAEMAQLRAVFGQVYTDPVEFNRAGPEAVFISQIQSGREGINLSTADCLVMYNIDFSAVSYWQARARLQTRDRAEAAKVYWVFTDGGIEEKIYGVVQGKRDFTLSHYKKINFDILKV